MKIKLTAITLTFLILTSCASIIHGSSQTVTFSSQPPGATITIDGKVYGKTPQSISLKRKGRLNGESSSKKSYDVKVSLEGYYSYDVKVNREMDGWFIGNILFGGIIGIIVDASNGAMYKLTPDQIIAQMNKSTAMNSTEKDQIYFAVTLEIDPSWEKIGQLNKVK